MNMLTRKQKLYLIDNLIAAHNAIHKQLDILKLSLYPDPGSPLYTAVFDILNSAIESTSAAIGDTGKWIDWYIHDNDCGKNGYEATYANAEKIVVFIVNNTSDILDVVEFEAGNDNKGPDKHAV